MSKIKHGIQIKFYETCNNTPVVPYYFKAMNKFHSVGYPNHNCVSFNCNQSAFVAVNEDDKIIGMVLLEDEPWKNALCIVHGYVDQAYRQKCIYTRLWKKTVKRARKLGRLYVDGGTSPNNHTMMSIMEKQGRRPVSVLYTFDVPKKSKGKLP